VFRESAETAEQTVEQIESQVLDLALAGVAEGADAESDLSRHLLHAVEAYKASCAVAGEQPTQEDAWLVLFSALQLEDAK
jgi:hypothetical protein